MVNSCEGSDYNCDGISLIMSLSSRRGASAHMSVLMWEHRVPHRHLDAMKFTAPPPLSLLLACELSFMVGLKISSLLHCALKSLTEYIYIYIYIYIHIHTHTHTHTHIYIYGRPVSDIDQIPILIPHRNSL
jgi:hypothetical protein